MTLDQVNKAVIVTNIFAAVIFTSVMGSLSNGQATISWQMYLYALVHPELPLIMGGLLFRWMAKMELGAYDT